MYYKQGEPLQHPEAVVRSVTGGKHYSVVHHAKTSKHEEHAKSGLIRTFP